MKTLLIGTLFLLTFEAFAQAPIHSRKPTLVFTKKAKLVPMEKIASHLGDSISIVDSVYSTRLLTGGAPLTFLNMGGNYPHQKVTVVIRGQNFDKFDGKPEEIYKGRIIGVSGKLTEYKGKLQIEVTDPVQIEFVQPFNRE